MKRIVIDTSTGCLDYYEHPYDIRQIRIALFFGEKRYLDGLDMKAQEFYDRLHNNPEEIPSTSQPSPGDVLEFFEGLIAEGFDEAIVTTISSKLSGVYGGINTVAKILEDRIKIHVFDTKTVCIPEGLFALEAAKLTQEGKSVEEVIKHLEKMRERVKILFAVDNLQYLVKNGRLSGASGLVATMLKIKPLLEVKEDGTIVSVEKIRTTKRALDRVVEKYVEDTAGKKVQSYLVYTGNVALKEYLKEKLLEQGIKDLLEVPCTPIVGCHVGPDALGVGFFILED